MGYNIRLNMHIEERDKSEKIIQQEEQKDYMISRYSVF
jgi:hypothetical protein